MTMARSGTDKHPAQRPVVRRIAALEKRLEYADEAAIDEIEIDLNDLSEPQRKLLLLRPWCSSDAEACERIGRSTRWLRKTKSQNPEFSRAMSLRADQLHKIIRGTSAQLMSRNMLLLAEATEVGKDGNPKHGWNVFFKAQEETRKLSDHEKDNDSAPVIQQAIQMFNYGE